MDANQEATVGNVQKLTYQRTLTLAGAWNFRGEVLSKLDRLALLNFFWENPLDVIREACVEELRNKYPNGADCEAAQWLEERLSLIKAGVHEMSVPLRAKYWERLLSWYLFGSILQPRIIPELQIRALELAISLFKADLQYAEIDVRSALAKIIAGAIRKYPELYWAPSVPEFLEASLAHENRAIVERALKLICAAGDSSFLTHISDLGRKAEEAWEKVEDYKTTNDFEERFAAAKAQSVLKETVRHLLVRKTEEMGDTIDFQVAIAQALRKIGALDFLPKVTLNLPEKVSASESKFPISMVVEHEAENNPFSETGPMEAVLGQCRLVVTVNGSHFEGGEWHHEVRFATRYIRVHRPYVYPPYSVKNEASVGKVEGAARKTIRVRVIMWHATENKDGKPCLEHIATLTRYYIHRAE